MMTACPAAGRSFSMAQRGTDINVEAKSVLLLRECDGLFQFEWREVLCFVRLAFIYCRVTISNLDPRIGIRMHKVGGEQCVEVVCDIRPVWRERRWLGRFESVIRIIGKRIRRSTRRDWGVPGVTLPCNVM